MKKLKLKISKISEIFSEFPVALINSAHGPVGLCRLVADARERRLRSTASRTCVVIRDADIQHLWR